MTLYADSPDFADLEPILQDDGPNPIAPIAYTPEYADATMYLRALMEKREYSSRAAELTQRVIYMNPGHYTVWLYRKDILEHLNKLDENELAFCNRIAIEYPKNYQVWNYRTKVLEAQKQNAIRLIPAELEFISKMLDDDSKNYHVWSYRSMLVRKWNVWEEELSFVDRLLHEDVRNNSAWNHRFYSIFRPGNDEIDLTSEIAYVAEKIKLAPENPSPWNYLRGLVKSTSQPITILAEISKQYVTIDQSTCTVQKAESSHALSLLAEIYQFNDSPDYSRTIYQSLAEHYDPIRKNYWNWQIEKLNLGGL